MHERRRQQRRLVERPTAVLLGASLLAAIAVALPATDADAAIEPIGVSPASGAAGTRVTVSGSDCAPGLLGGSALNHVSVVSSTLHVGVSVPVGGNGSWSTSFTVPAGTPAGPVAIAPLCVSSGVGSLTTFYTPGTFTVTAAAPPTTAPPPPVTTPTTRGTSQTTRPTSSTTKGGTAGGGSGSGTGSSPGTAAGGSSRGGGNGSRAGSGGASGADHVVSALGTVGDKRSGAVAGLRSPELASDSSGGPGGVSWWWWLVLAAVLGAGLGTWLWARRRNRPGAEPVAEDGEDGPDGPGAPPEPEPDDWLDETYVDDIPTVTR